MMSWLYRLINSFYLATHRSNNAKRADGTKKLYFTTSLHSLNTNTLQTSFLERIQRRDKTRGKTPPMLASAK